MHRKLHFSLFNCNSWSQQFIKFCSWLSLIFYSDKYPPFTTSLLRSFSLLFSEHRKSVHTFSFNCNSQNIKWLQLINPRLYSGGHRYLQLKWTPCSWLSLMLYSGLYRIQLLTAHEEWWKNIVPEVKLNPGLLFTEAHWAEVNSGPRLNFTEYNNFLPFPE